MEKIGILINKRMNQHKLGESARASQLVHRANQLLSKWLKTEDHEVRAVTVKNGVLSINVNSSVWSQEVWGVKQKLLREIQSEYGKEKLNKIVTKTLTIK